MSCTNCFNGCVETTSDKCVKYTGNDIGFLNIHTGDSLEAIEKSITDYLATVFNGERIFPTIDPTIICDVVKQFLPCEDCGDYSLVDILTAIIKAVCAIEEEIIVERERIDEINDTFSEGCLTVDPDAGIHTMVQAIINRLCTAVGDINTLGNLFATCITTSTINTYIQNYLNTLASNNKMYTKMVPYVIYPFYPTNAFMTGLFDITGAGLGDWEKIYLCNGVNGTPDLRGRSLIGTTNMGGGAFNSVVDPGISGNPTYTLGTEEGQNSVVLSGSQVGNHTHTATATVTDPGHNTTIKFSTKTTSLNGGYTGPDNDKCPYPVLKIEDTPASDCEHTDRQVTSTTKDKTDITVAVSNANNSGGDAHTNIHPVHACHYMMFIP